MSVLTGSRRPAVIQPTQHPQPVASSCPSEVASFTLVRGLLSQRMLGPHPRACRLTAPSLPEAQLTLAMPQQPKPGACLNPKP